MDVSQTGKRQPRDLGEKRTNGIYSKSWNKRDAERLGKKFKKGNGDLTPLSKTK